MPLALAPPPPPLALALASALVDAYSQILGNLVDFFFGFEQKTVRRNSKNHKILERCKGKNVKLEKREKMTPWTQKSALIQPLTSL